METAKDAVQTAKIMWRSKPPPWAHMCQDGCCAPEASRQGAPPSLKIIPIAALLCEAAEEDAPQSTDRGPSAELFPKPQLEVSARRSYDAYAVTALRHRQVLMAYPEILVMLERARGVAAAASNGVHRLRALMLRHLGFTALIASGAAAALAAFARARARGSLVRPHTFPFR